MVITLGTTVANQIDALVIPNRNIQADDLKSIQQRGWTGQVCTPYSRAMYWRITLGVVSNSQSSQWKRDLVDSISDYCALQKEILPDISSMDQDPLSHMLGSPGEHAPGWDKYFEPKDSLKLIIADLDRLYLTGVDDEYFKDIKRRKMLENILFIWAARHESIAYRQGMHEIVGTVLLVVESELEGWSVDTDLSESDERALATHPLRGCFTQANVEAYTYWLFERIMKDLAPLYDPAVGADQQPAVVQYCTNIQENLLRHNDPELCDFLESQFIQSQLYGMRWARLMLGREFSITDTQALRIWDYIFASCIVLPQPVLDMLDPLSMDLLGMSTSDNNTEIAASRSRYGPHNPLLIMLGNFMLAMLLHVRNEILAGDVSTALTVLMHYPVMENITPIVDYADMIRRGVLDPGAHAGMVLDGGLLSEPAVSSKYTPLDNSTPAVSSSRSKELKNRLKEAATPMLSSMGRRVSKLVNSSNNTDSSQYPSDDPLDANNTMSPPQENMSRTHTLFNNLTRSSSSSSSNGSSGSTAAKSPQGSSVDIFSLTEPTINTGSSSSCNSSNSKKSLFSFSANKANSSSKLAVLGELEKKVQQLSETQRFVGDSILDIIGDLEQTVITCIDVPVSERRDGHMSIIKLKDLVRVLCGELSIAEYSDNCSHDPIREDTPRRRTSSAMGPDGCTSGTTTISSSEFVQGTTSDTPPKLILPLATDATPADTCEDGSVPVSALDISSNQAVLVVEKANEPPSPPSPAVCSDTDTTEITTTSVAITPGTTTISTVTATDTATDATTTTTTATTAITAKRTQRTTSVSEMMSLPDSDDDVNVSPRIQRKKEVAVAVPISVQDGPL